MGKKVDPLTQIGGPEGESSVFPLFGGAEPHSRSLEMLAIGHGTARSRL